MIAIKKIMIPTDFSEYSNHALKYAVTIAQSFQAKLYLMHVCELPLTSPMLPAEPYPTATRAQEQREEEKTLKRLAEELRTRGMDAEPVFELGRPYMEIVRAAKELDVDLVILATHGRKGLTHLVFGSTAEKVVRLSPCPVLTVKHPEHEFVT
jgi:nucleotide-binding universal stress UspA family protein